MISLYWQETPLVERIRWLRYVLPPALVLVVVVYQLGVAQRLEQSYGHIVHYGVEIGFYSLVGPVVTLLTLSWIERRLRENERLERQVQARKQQLASLTAASADAILSLDSQGYISSWNRGATRMLGYQERQILGQPLNRLIKEVDDLAEKAAGREMVEGFEATALARDGRKLTVELTQTQLHNAGEGTTASLIIMRDVTARRERALILEEERARIARDLHDGVAQTLYFMALQIDMIHGQLDQKPGQVTDRLKEVGQTARKVIREVRRSIFSLRPLDWPAGNFGPSLTSFIQEYAEQAGWQADVTISDENVVIPDRIEPAIFRLVQESLNNAAKHAGAKHIQVTIEPGNDGAILNITVHDDGRGFNPAEVHEAGLGLNQMRGRVNALGGRIEIVSQPGSGTTVTAQLPIAARNNGGVR